jgi:hypothetical protein
VETIEYRAAAAGHSVSAESWQAEPESTDRMLGSIELIYLIDEW